MRSRNTLLVAVAGLVPAALARTDLSGCTSSEVVLNGGASYIWYVPDTGEVCELIDCGGGRGPPITTLPGCAGYAGTATVTPSYLPDFGSKAAASSIPTAASTFVVSTQAAPEPTSSLLVISSQESAANLTWTNNEPPGIVITGDTTRTVYGSDRSRPASTTPGPATGSATGSATSTKSTSSVVTGAAAGMAIGGVTGLLGAAAALGAGMAVL